MLCANGDDNHEFNQNFPHRHPRPDPGPGPDQGGNCPQLETIVRNITWQTVAANPPMAAKLLRLHFHDCFVNGCDGSILLDSTANNTAEKDAIPNGSLAPAFPIIDKIKAKVEEECPETVSCADIIALTARDAVSFQFQRPLWPVFLGRKDGRVSLESQALSDLPSPSSDFTTLLQLFNSNGLDLTDLVALSGAHTIGLGHCGVILGRLYNFTGKGDTDPSIDPNYANFLKHKCNTPPDPSVALDMDPGSSLSFDSHYYVTLYQNKGLFQSDAALLTDPRAARISKLYQNQNVFFNQFRRSIINMGSIKVLTGEEGEIRKNCRAVN